MKTYTDINALSLSDARAAIAMGEINFANVTDDCKPELARRLAALRDRVRRLKATEARRQAVRNG